MSSRVATSAAGTRTDFGLPRPEPKQHRPLGFGNSLTDDVDRLGLEMGEVGYLVGHDSTVDGDQPLNTIGEQTGVLRLLFNPAVSWHKTVLKSDRRIPAESIG